MENEALRARVMKLETQAWEHKQVERVRAKLQQDNDEALRARVMKLETQACEHKQVERVPAKLQRDHGGSHSKHA